MEKETGFHNTIPIEGEQLEKAKQRAVTQQGQILQLFKREPDRWFTPFDIQDITGEDRTMPDLRYMLITSIRRAITNLTHAGYLVKGDKEMQVREQWGVNNNKWRYNNG